MRGRARTPLHRMPTSELFHGRSALPRPSRSGRPTTWSGSSAASVVAGDIVGYDAEAVDGDIGEVSEASADVGASYVVIDTRPWISGKKVILPAIALERVDHENERVWVNQTKAKILNGPEFDAAPGRAAR